MGSTKIRIKPVTFLLIFLVVYGYSTSKIDKETSRSKQLFDFNWRFKIGELKDAKNPEYNDKSWKMINLPHDWSIEEPFSSKWASCTGWLPGGIGWYRKHFSLPEKYKNKKIFIQFDGIYKKSKVWINGHPLGYRPYGYISFQYDLTPYLNFGNNKKNVIAVQVDHKDYADSRWYTGSGIYRHVWLKIMNKLHIANWGNYITTSDVLKNSANVKIETKVKNESEKSKKCTIINTIVDKDGEIKQKAETDHNIPANGEYRFVQHASISKPKLWSPDNPYLYEVFTKIKSNDIVVDDKKTNLGIRTFHFDADSGFFLNGKNILLKGTCNHHDLGPLGAALNNSALERRIKVLKEMGCNAIRTSHNPPSPELLEYCDQYGMLVMDEAFDEWARGKKKWLKGWNVGQEKGMAGKGEYFSLDGYNEHFEEWAIQDIKNMVRRDRNHPSIILWSIGNEIDYPNDPYSYDKGKPPPEELVPIAGKLIKAVKSIDTTRPVTAALANMPVSNKTGLANLLDVVGYNYQEKYYEEDHNKFPNRKIIGSENGDSPEAWQAVKNNPYVASQFLWTGWDYLGEAGRYPIRSNGSGLINLCGFKKVGFYYRKSLWSDNPMVYLITEDTNEENRAHSHWNYKGKDNQHIKVLCFTNCEKVELLLNGKSIGTKKLTSSPRATISWKVPYQPGTLKALGKKNDKVIATHELKTAGEPTRLLFSTDTDTITADGRDLSFVKVKVVDKDGNLVPNANNRITFNIEGHGKIIATGNGDHSSLQSFQVNYKNAYKGKCLAIIQSTLEPGAIHISAHANGLLSDSLSIYTVNSNN